MFIVIFWPIIRRQKTDASSYAPGIAMGVVGALAPRLFIRVGIIPPEAQGLQ
jgi:hypothetical protein